MKKIYEYLNLSKGLFFYLLIAISLICFPKAINYFSGTNIDLSEIVANGWNIIAGILVLIYVLIMFCVNIFKVRKICIIKIDGLKGKTLKEETIVLLAQKQNDFYTINCGRFDEDDLNKAVTKLIYKNEFYNERKINCDKHIFYGVSYTPFIFLLGILYGNVNKKYEFYHYFRPSLSETKFKKLKKTKETKYKINIIDNDKKSSEIVISLSTSLKIGDDIGPVFNDLRHIRIESEVFHFDTLNNKSKMNFYAEKVVETIRKFQNDYEKIHLLLSTSTEITFLLGTLLSTNYDKNINVYHYDKENPIKYTWSIGSKTKKISMTKE